MENKITVNGVEYERIQHKQPKGNRTASKWLMAAAMLAAPMMNYGGSNYSRSLPSNIDIVKEFELIQQKKSKLSKWERDQVVHIFNQNFKIKIHETTIRTPHPIVHI